MRHAPVGYEQPVTASLRLLLAAMHAIPPRRIREDPEDDEPRDGIVDDQVVVDEDDEDIDPDEDKRPPRPD